MRACMQPCVCPETCYLEHRMTDFHQTYVNPFAALLTSYLVMRKLVAVCPSDEYTRHNPIAVMLSVAHSVAAIF